MIAHRTTLGRRWVELCNRWVELCNRRESPLSLACVRVLVASVLLVDLLAAWGLGALPAVWAPPPDGIGWGATGAHPPLLVTWFGASTNVAIAAWLLAVLAALLVLFGAFFRFSSWLLVFATLDLMWFTPDGDAIDGIMRIVLPLLALSDASATLSVDAWRRKRKAGAFAERVQAFAWPRYIIALQLLWVYFSAAHHRGKASWGISGGFSAIADVLGDPHFARFKPGTFAAIYPLTQLGSLLTMAFEFGAVLFPLLAYWEAHRQRGGVIGSWARRLRLRNVWLTLGVGLHLGIAATMQLGIFPFGILALYPAFIPPSELGRWLNAARRRVRAGALG